MKETSNMKETVCLSTKTSDFFKELTEMQFFTLSKGFTGFTCLMANAKKK